MADQTLAELSVSLGHVSSRVDLLVEGIIRKGALNIKNQMVDDAKGHPYFRRLSRAINYSITSSGKGIEAEIGPRSFAGGGTGLAGIAYFGSSRPGGKTVADPKGALDKEAETVEKLIAEAAGRVVGSS